MEYIHISHIHADKWNVRVDGIYYIYLPLFGSDNPEAVNIMGITNIRAFIAEASIHPREGPSTNCQGKDELCFTETLKRKRLDISNPAAEILETSKWLPLETNALLFFLLPNPFVFGHLPNSHLFLDVYLISPCHHHEPPLSLLVFSGSHSLALVTLDPIQLSSYLLLVSSLPFCIRCVSSTRR